MVRKYAKREFIEPGHPLWGKTILAYGSAGPRALGRIEVRVNKDQSIEIEEEDWGGGSTQYFARRNARRLAKAILAATDKNRDGAT